MDLISVTDPNEVEMVTALRLQLERVPNLRSRHEAVFKMMSEPNSRMADDDRRTSPLQISHFVEVALVVGIDNLLMLRDVLMPEPGRIRLRHTAHYPNMRTALESAALAMWLLGPESQSVRVLRTLQARQTDTDYAVRLGRAAAEMIGDRTKEARSAAESIRRDTSRQRKSNLASIREIAQREQIDPTEFEAGQPSYAEIVRSGTKMHYLGGPRAETIWRIISGFTHPSPNRAAFYASHVSTEDREEGVARIVTTANPTYALMATTVAVDTFAATIDLVHERRTTPAKR